MLDATKRTGALGAWLGLPGMIEKALEGLPEDGLDLRGGADGWSIREIVHHLVEANLIASNILIAALAKSGCVYDWSWVTPGGTWTQRMGYGKVPIGPALDTLRALCEHLAAVIRASENGLCGEVRLLDAPGAVPYTKTVEELLWQEVEHAEGHLRDVPQIRAAQGQ